MKERIEVLSFKYKVVYAVFFFFLIITFLSPLSGEDIKFYIIGRGGIRNIFSNLDIGKYGIINSFLVSFLSYNKILFNIIFSLFMGYFAYIICSMMGIVKNKYYYLVPFILILLVSTFTFSYNYMCVSNTIMYTFPTIMMFIYFYSVLKRESRNIILDIVLEIFIIIYVSLSSVHFGLIFLIGNLIFSTYMWKKGEMFKRYIVYIVVQLIFVIFSFFSFDIEFYSNLSYGLSNIPMFIDSFFSKNIILVIISCIPINRYLTMKLQNSKHKRTVIALFNMILLFTLLYNFSYYVPVNINLVINKYFGIFATENWYYIFYYILYFVLLILSVRYYIIKSKNKLYLTIFLIMSSALFPLFIIFPSWDVGCSIIFVFSLVMICSICIKDMEVEIYGKVILSILIFLVTYYFSMFAVFKYVDYSRTKYIEEQIDKNVDVIEVKASPLYLVWRYNPVSIFSEDDFKMYYNIPMNKKIEVKYFGIFKEIEKKVKNLI